MIYVENEDAANRQINIIAEHIKNGVPDKVIAMLFDGKEKNYKSGNLVWDIDDVREIRERFKLDEEINQPKNTGGFFDEVIEKSSKYFDEAKEKANNNVNKEETKENNDDLYLPDVDGVKRALSALLTQDPDTKKLFERGSRTYVKLFGGHINNFINLNSNLIQASISLKTLEKFDHMDKKDDLILKKLENIDEKDGLILQNLIMMNKKNDLILKKLEDIDNKLSNKE